MLTRKTLLMYFNQSLRGLTPGAPVDFRGVVIGEVKSIGVEFDRAEQRVPHAGAGAGLPRPPAPPAPAKPASSRAPRSRSACANLAEKGLRAQLRNGNLG